MSTNIIGVDNGNAKTKTVHTAFVSGLTKHDLKPPIVDEYIKYKGKYYTLSNERIPYQRDKTKDDKCFILSLFGIAKEIMATGKYSPVMDLVLGVDLPPEHYSLQKDKFANYFKSFGETVSFEYNDKPFEINIMDVYVFPQGFAATATRASELKSYSRVYIIDIGGYTTDVLLISKGKLDLTYCRSLETGIITMNNKIAGKISSVYDMKIDDGHIFDVLSGKKTVLTQDVIDQIKGESGVHAAKILNDIRELGIDLKTNPAIFVGGGSLLLEEYIKQSGMVSVTEFIPDVSANAMGCTILATAQHNKRKAG